MKRTGLNDDNGDLHKVGTYLGVARLPLSPPDAERNKPWPENKCQTLSSSSAAT